MRIAFIAPFGLQPKGTVSARMLPLAHALASRGHLVRIVIPPWDDPSSQSVRNVAISSLVSSSQEGDGVQIVTLPLPRFAPYSLALTYGLVREALRPSGYSITRTFQFSSLTSEGGLSAKEGAINHAPTVKTRRGVIYRALYPSAERKIPGGEKQHRLHDLATFRAEVVHVFKPIAYSGLAGFALAAMGVPWVLDTDDWEGPGGWGDANPYSGAQKLVAAVQDAMLPRLAPVVTAASRTLEARAWSFGLPRRRVLYMPNGVWRGKYGEWVAQPAEVAQLRRQYGLEGKPVVLLYTRFAEFPYLWPLDVLQKLVEKHPGVRLLVVGSGFFGEEEKLRVEAANQGIADHVVIVGRVPEDRLPAYLALGDVALYPMEDTLLNRAKSPVKVLEPMVMGLPVVAHTVGEVSELIGDAGMLVQPGDLDGMAEGVSVLLDNSVERENLGGKARERVWARFNWEQLCLAAEEAYSRALKRRWTMDDGR